MFKKAYVVFIFLILFSFSFSLRLVEPISKELQGDDFVGSIVPGQELELIFSKEFGKFDNLEFSSLLPNNFDVKIEEYIESIKVFIKADEETPQKSYKFNILLKGKDIQETATMFFTVDNSLLDVSLLNYSFETNVGSEANYDFFFRNNSDADAEFRIRVLLPAYWLKETQKDFYKTVVVPKKSSLKDSISILPQISGAQNFSSQVFLQNNKTIKEFTSHIEVNPTLKSKFNSVINGLPFYSISIFPSYLLNGFLSILFF
jgi:hypothetical protein